MIPEEVVDQVSCRHGRYRRDHQLEHVRLKKVGSVYRGPCPFHQGTNNNFSVQPRGGYTCFVCGEKGSVFTFVQKRLGLSFVEAVKYVGEKSGVEVREVERRREGPDPREPRWELNATVAAWFREMLWESELCAPAREYTSPGRNVLGVRRRIDLRSGVRPARARPDACLFERARFCRRAADGDRPAREARGTGRAAAPLSRTADLSDSSTRTRIPSDSAVDSLARANRNISTRRNPTFSRRGGSCTTCRTRATPSVATSASFSSRDISTLSGSWTRAWSQ